jgi:hypothetical protein
MNQQIRAVTPIGDPEENIVPCRSQQQGYQVRGCQNASTISDDLQCLTRFTWNARIGLKRAQGQTSEHHVNDDKVGKEEGLCARGHSTNAEEGLAVRVAEERLIEESDQAVDETKW